jgi:RNA polymerase sporulation-specific sigma factor
MVVHSGLGERPGAPETTSTSRKHRRQAPTECQGGGIVAVRAVRRRVSAVRETGGDSGRGSYLQSHSSKCFVGDREAQRPSRPVCGLGRGRQPRCNMASAEASSREHASRRSGKQYELLSDEELVCRAQHGGDRRACECLLHRYRNLVRAKVRSYFLIGAERDDLLQIGMIGLWEAVTDFRPQRHTSFACFAKVCIQRQMISAVKAATRQKHVPLNTRVSLETTANGDQGDRTLAELLPARPDGDPAAVVLGIEAERTLQDALRSRLSPLEWHVLSGYRAGRSYREIAERMGRKVKSVDNALSRIRHKLQADGMRVPGTADG